MTLRRRALTGTMSQALRHYLAFGCFSCGDLTLDEFLGAGKVLRGDFSWLRQRWGTRTAPQ